VVGECEDILAALVRHLDFDALVEPTGNSLGTVETLCFLRSD
jgi:hypothetical protein